MAKTAATAAQTAKKAKPKKPAKISYHRRPDDLHLDLWQLGLRKQFGEDNPFEVENVGRQPVFSEYKVWNPALRAYRARGGTHAAQQKTQSRTDRLAL